MNVPTKIRVAAVGAASIAALTLSAVPAQAGRYDCGTDPVCIWQEWGYGGPFIGGWGINQYEWGRSGWHDRATSIHNWTGQRYYIYENPFWTGRNTYIGPGSEFSDLSQTSGGLAWWENWNDRIDSSRF